MGLQRSGLAQGHDFVDGPGPGNFEGDEDAALIINASVKYLYIIMVDC